MRKQDIFLVGLLLLGCVVTAEAKRTRFIRNNQPFKDKYIGIVFPSSLGGIPKAGQVVYPDDALGVGVRYEEKSKGIRIDIYIYDYNIRGISSDPKSKIMENHFLCVCKDIFNMKKLGRYRNVRMTDIGGGVFDYDSNFLEYVRAEFSYDIINRENEASVPVISHLLLAGYRGYFIKLRCTYPQKLAKMDFNLLMNFIGDLKKCIPVNLKK